MSSLWPWRHCTGWSPSSAQSLWVWVRLATFAHDSHYDLPHFEEQSECASLGVARDTRPRPSLNHILPCVVLPQPRSSFIEIAYTIMGPPRVGNDSLPSNDNPALALLGNYMPLKVADNKRAKDEIPSAKTDFLIHMDDYVWTVHKDLLTSKSDYFRGMLSGFMVS